MSSAQSHKGVGAIGFNAGDIEASLKLNRDDFQRGMDAARAEGKDFAAQKYTAKADADTASADAKLAALRANADEYAKHVRTAKLDADIKTALAKLDQVNARLVELTARKSWDPTVGLQIAEFEAKRAVVEAQLARLAGLKAEIKMDSSQVDKTASSLTRIPPMAALIVAAFPPAAAAIAALPAAAGLVVAPIAAVAAGLDGIKIAVQPLAPQFVALKTAVSATFEQGLQPAVANVSALMPTLQAGLTGTATALSSMATQITAVTSSAPGLAAISGTFAGINNLIANLGPGMALFTQNVLNLASAGVQGLQGFAFQFLQVSQAYQHVVDAMVSSGQAQAAVQGLFSLLTALLQLTAPLVQFGSQLMAVLGPPLAAAISVVVSVLQPLVDLFGALPGPVQTAIVALVAIRVAMSALGPSGQAAAAGVATVGTAAAASAGKTGLLGKATGGLLAAFNPLSLALTAGVLIFSQIGQASQESAAAVAKFADAFRASGGAVDSAVRSMVVSRAEEQGLLKTTQDLGISTDQLVSALTGQGTAMGAVSQKVQESRGFWGALFDTLQHNPAGDTANKISNLSKELQTATEASKRLDTASQAMATSSGLTAVKAADASRQTGLWTKAMEELAKAQATVADKVKALAKVYADASGGPRTYAEATQDANDALRKLADSAANKLPPGIVSATGAINTATKAGSEFQKMILAAATASDELSASAIVQARELGQGPVQQYAAGAAALVTYRQKVIDASVAMGVGTTEAIKMADSLIKVPPNVVAQVSVPGAAEATVKALGLGAAIKSVEGDHVVIVKALTAAAQSELEALGFKVTHLPDGTVRVEPDTKAAEASIAKLQGEFPLHGSVQVGADTQPAHDEMNAFQRWLSTLRFEVGVTAKPNPQLPGLAIGATGMIVPGFAPGGTFPGTPFQAGAAQVFPPNQLRYTGDRNRDDEFYIPDDKAPRSMALLAELAKRRGFMLLPMADGGAVPSVPTAGVTSGAAGLAGAATVPGAQIPLTPETAAQLASQVTALTRVVVTLNPAVTATNTAFTATTGTVNTLSGAGGLQRLLAAVTGLLPALSQMSTSVTGTTVPSVTGLQTHLGLLTNQLTATTTGVVGSWQTMTVTTQTSVTGQQAAMSGLEQSLGGVRSAVGNTASWFADRMGSMRSAAADPVRFVITGPFNAGLIAAWNKLNAEFALGKAVEPLAVGFATGGEIPTSMHGAPPKGSTDTVPAWLTPDEIVINRDQAQRHRNFLLALNSGQAEAVQAAGGMYSRGPGYAAGGSVEAVQQFAAAQSGKPYVWGGVGPDGFDCSGYASALVNTALGSGSPFHRLGTTMTMPWAGLTPGLTSAFGLGWSAEHMASTIGGLNAEAGGSPSLVKFNRPDAAGATHPQFSGHASVPQVGGVFVGGPGGGGVDAQAVVDAAFAEAYRLVAQIVPTWPGNTTAAQGAGISKQAVDQVKAAALAKVSAVAGSAGPGGGAGVQRWAPVVDQALGMVGQPLSYRDTTLRRMNQESAGNPAAVNLTDSNAAAGHPSVGLMQVIAGTYAAYKDARRDVGPYAYGVSEDPLSNVLASMHYAIRQYGSLPAAYDRAGGYDQGGLLMPGLTAALNTTGVPEQVLNPATTESFGRLTEWLTTDVGQRVSAGAASSAGGVDQGQLVSAVRAVVGEVVAAVPRPLIGGNVQVGGDRQFADVDELLFKIRHARHEGIYAR